MSKPYLCGTRTARTTHMLIDLICRTKVIRRITVIADRVVLVSFFLGSRLICHEWLLFESVLEKLQLIPDL